MDIDTTSSFGPRAFLPKTDLSSRITDSTILGSRPLKSLIAYALEGFPLIRSGDDVGKIIFEVCKNNGLSIKDHESPCFCNSNRVTVSNSPLFSRNLKKTINSRSFLNYFCIEAAGNGSQRNRLYFRNEQGLSAEIALTPRRRSSARKASISKHKKTRDSSG